MDRKNILYTAYARMPTENAHGYQICKMCEAFGARHSVQLLHPDRRPKKHLHMQQDVFDYYDVQRTFSVQTLKKMSIAELRGFSHPAVAGALFLVSMWLWARHAGRVAASLQPDIVYTRDIIVAYRLTRMGLPVAYECHTVPSGLQVRFLKHSARHGTMAGVVALTSCIKKRLVDLGFAENDILVAPDCVDPAYYAAPADKNARRKACGLPEDTTIIGYVGRFKAMHREKGLPELIRSIQTLRAKRPDVMLVCVGGPMQVVPAYRQHARDLGIPDDSLRFVDRVPNRDVPRWIQACDVVTMPLPWNDFSAYYTSPMKMFEYMAAGVPIVASDLPALRDVLHHGENAWLVSPGDPEALARGIDEILSRPDRAGALALQAQKDVKNFTWDQRAEAVLRHVAGRGSART